MTEIEKKALALVNEVRASHGLTPCPLVFVTGDLCFKALCRAIEQHEAFRQEVSDAVEAALSVFNQLVLDDRGEAALRGARLVFARFIIAKPDPIAEAWIEATGNTVGMEPLNAALAARGLKIVWGEG